MELTGDERLILLLRLREGESFENIADTLRITVKRCRERFASILARDVAADDPGIITDKPRPLRTKQSARPPGGFTVGSNPERLAEVAQRRHLQKQQDGDGLAT